MQVLRAKTQKMYLVTNLSDFSRVPSLKRKIMSGSLVVPSLCEDADITLGENEPSPILKRQCPSETIHEKDSSLARMSTSVKTSKGSWNPNRRNFKKTKNSSSVLSMLRGHTEKS